MEKIKELLLGINPNKKMVATGLTIGAALGVAINPEIANLIGDWLVAIGGALQEYGVAPAE